MDWLKQKWEQSDKFSVIAGVCVVVAVFVIFFVT